MTARQGLSRPGAAPSIDRMGQAHQAGAGGQVQGLLRIARAGLPIAYDPETAEFAQTTRRLGPTVRPEGSSLRYTAIAALGLARLDPDEQRRVLAGRTAAHVAGRVGAAALGQSDPGAVALAVWAQAEITGSVDEVLLGRFTALLTSRLPLPTVDLAWMLTAAVAAGGRTAKTADVLADRLIAAQGTRGIFPHVVPARSQGRWRRHVGSFADQVYPLQALARRHRAAADPMLLEAAELTASTLCELQGGDGQWWWHYDARTGEVVEGFPVYAVHQHSMAPMALFDLAEAGGPDHVAHIVRGLRWLDVHPEVDDELVSESSAAIWRKVGRRERGKTVRGLSAATTSLHPGLRMPGIDRVWPPGRIDHECRPYELGWLLYAWLPAREVATDD